MAADPNTSTLAAQLAILSVGQWPVWADVADTDAAPTAAADGVLLEGSVTALARVSPRRQTMRRAWLIPSAWTVGDTWTIDTIPSTGSVVYDTTGDANLSASLLDFATAINTAGTTAVLATPVNSSGVEAAPYVALRLDYTANGTPPGEEGLSLAATMTTGQLLGLVEAASVDIRWRVVGYGLSQWDEPQGGLWEDVVGFGRMERLNVAGVTRLHGELSNIVLSAQNSAGADSEIRMWETGDPTYADTRPLVQVGPCAESAP